MTNEELLQIIEQAARDKVTELDLSFQNLTTLPAEIVQLTNLQTLYLYGNQLSSLPAEFGKLTNLQTLDLSYNQLSSLPPEIRQLQNLEKLDLRSNPVPIPPEILGSKDLSKDPGDVNEILDFYFRVQDPAETEPFYEAKFLIIGEGGAGKTSLAKKISDETYELQPEEKSTEGIEVIQWHFTLPNGQDFRVNIWDFGGQEIYHQTHQFFLSKRSLYVLVADTRKDNTDFYWWLKVVELLSDKSPVLIIKNEKQNRDCQVNERQLRGEFSNLKEILATNKDQTRAEVIENYNQREIKIRVAGNRKKELMATVTHELEKIHKSYEHLEYQTLVPCNCENCKDIQMPHFYDRDVLYRSLDARNSQIQCQKSFRMVDVRRLIDDVLLTSPNLQIPMSESVTRNKVFISYSHKDQKWFDDLKIHLEPLIREQNLKVWDDTQIEPGAVWRDEIQAALATAKVAVLLVSPNFLASSFISQNELPPLLEAAKAEGVKILWIPLRASNYTVTAIEQYQATHASDRPLNTIAAGRRDKAWVDICEIIKAAAVSE